MIQKTFIVFILCFFITPIYSQTQLIIRTSLDCSGPLDQMKQQTVSNYQKRQAPEDRNDYVWSLEVGSKRLSGNFASEGSPTNRQLIIDEGSHMILTISAIQSGESQTINFLNFFYYQPEGHEGEGRITAMSGKTKTFEIHLCPLVNNVFGMHTFQETDGRIWTYSHDRYTSIIVGAILPGWHIHTDRESNKLLGSADLKQGNYQW